MAVLPSNPHRITRSRWLEPFVTAVGAVILGLTFSNGPAPVLTTPSSTPLAPENTIQLQRTGPPPDLRQLVASASERRIRLALKPKSLPPQGHIYHIQWGNTLWGLAQRFHVSIAAIETTNHLNGTTIEAGTTLVIPDTYVVKPGDTLASIATHYDVPLVLLWHENRLTKEKLHPGQTLVLPYTGRLPSGQYSGLTEPSDTTQLTDRGGIGLSASLTPEDMLMMAHLVQAEAGNQPFLGQVAVAAVVLNRLKTPGFANTVDGVIFASGQFESVTNGTFWEPPSALAMMAVKAAVSGWDPSNGALYFYNPSMTYNGWMNTLPATATIGNQVFCR